MAAHLTTVSAYMWLKCFIVAFPVALPPVQFTLPIYTHLTPVAMPHTYLTPTCGTDTHAQHMKGTSWCQKQMDLGERHSVVCTL